MKKRPYKKLFKTYILHGEKATLAERQQIEEGLRYTSLLIQINQVHVYNLFFLIWVIYCFSELSHIKNCIIRYFTVPCNETLLFFYFSFNCVKCFL